MKSAFNKDFLRSITHGWGRFIAIAVIAALGTGFYGGLRMTCPDMKLSADSYFDAADFGDFRVVSTLGFDDDDIEALAEVEGVEEVTGEYEADALADIGGVQYAVRVHGIDTDALAESDDFTIDAFTQIAESGGSAQGALINQPILTSGEWPDEPGECVLADGAVLDSEVQIGDTVALVSGTSDLDDTFEVVEYTVVGFVESPYYVYTGSFGSTSLGSGSIDDYLYVSEEDFADDLPYTGAFVTVEGSHDVEFGSPEYDAIIEPVKKRIEAASDELAESRLTRLKADYQAELDDSTDEYETEKKSALVQLASAREELAEASGELASAESELSSGASTLASSESELESGWAEYRQGVAELASQKSAANKKLAKAQAQLDEQEAQVEEAEAYTDDLESGIEEAEAGISQLESGISQAQSSVSQLESAIAVLDAQIEDLSGSSDDADAEALAALQTERATLAAQLETANATLSSLQTQLEQVTAQRDEAQDQLDGIASARAQIEAAKKELAAQRTAANKRFSKAQAKLDAAKAQLVSGASQLAAAQAEYDAGLEEYNAGLAEYEDGLAEYESSKSAADAGFSETEGKLADAQAAIDDLEQPDIYVLDYNKNTGAASFISDADRIDSIARVFPFIFFLVAALVALTTMTRMVEEERVLIGTYKALGYSNGRIASRYLVYALLASGVGSVIGIVSLSQFLPWFIMNAYGIVYELPVHPTPIDPGIAVMSAALGIGIILAATGFAAYSTLRETPAALMLPRAPKAGKRILVERIRPLWRRLSFLWKVTARNIFRYKRRFFMAVIGIAGCTALLLTGFGLHDSINDIIDRHYGPISHFEVTISGTDDDQDEDETAAVESVLGDEAYFTEYTAIQDTNMIAMNERGNEYRLEVMVPEDAEAFQADYFTLRERVSQEGLELEDGTAIIAEKRATALGLEVGDTFTVYEEDEVGNAIGDGYELVVGGIMESYVGGQLIMTAQTYEDVFGEEPVYTTYLAKEAADTDDGLRLAANEALVATGGVNTVSYSDETIEFYRTALQSVNAVVVILIVAAALLAFVVIYNLTNINISERQREIATLKVLGFTPGEVNSYIFRETILLAVLGALVGLLLGIWMEGFVVTTAEVDYVMFGREIHAMSFVLSFVLTMVFAAAVSLLMRRKLDRISMVESLKSVE